MATKKTSKKSAAAKKPAAKKTAAKKTATKKPVAKKAATKKSATKKAAAGSRRKALTPEQRYNEISKTAYYIAERHQWTREPTDCWLEAEADVTARFGP